MGQACSVHRATTYLKVVLHTKENTPKLHSVLHREMSLYVILNCLLRIRREIVPVYFENHQEHTVNKLAEQNARI
jgi:hypothetical protein